MNTANETFEVSTQAAPSLYALFGTLIDGQPKIDPVPMWVINITPKGHASCYMLYESFLVKKGSVGRFRDYRKDNQGMMIASAASLEFHKQRMVTYMNRLQRRNQRGNHEAELPSS